MKVRVTVTMFGIESHKDHANVLEAMKTAQVFVENGITCTVSPIVEKGNAA